MDVGTTTGTLRDHCGDGDLGGSSWQLHGQLESLTLSHRGPAHRRGVTGTAKVVSGVFPYLGLSVAEAKTTFRHWKTHG